MSHFTVLVCISKERLTSHNNDINSAISEMMEPYQENNSGTCPEKYLTFDDSEDYYTQEYESGTSLMYKLPSGRLICKYDSNIKNIDSLEASEIEISHRKRYLTFENFMYDYCGNKERDKETGRYGSWVNENAKWDYWRIGGRWNGKLYVKPGTEVTINTGWDSLEDIESNTSDVCKISDLDLDKVQEETVRRAKEFWSEYTQLLKNGNSDNHDPFDGPRYTALDIGLCKVVKDPTEGKELGGFRWGDIYSNKDNDDRRDWYDVYNRDISKEEFLKNYCQYFNPIKTYVALDDDGWCESGEMGWFGVDNSTPDSKMKYSNNFMQKFILNKDPDTTLVVCDCHI